MTKKLMILFFTCLIFLQNSCIFGPFSNNDIRINLLSSDLDFTSDTLEWSVQIINDGNAYIHQLLIMVDFHFNGGAGGSGTESMTFNIPSINIEIGQTYLWEESIFESDFFRNNRDFVNLISVSVRMLEASENGVEIVREIYSGNEGLIYP